MEHDHGEVFECHETRLGIFAKIRPSNKDRIIWRYRDGFGKFHDIDMDLDQAEDMLYFKREVLRMLFSINLNDKYK